MRISQPRCARQIYQAGNGPDDNNGEFNAFPNSQVERYLSAGNVWPATEVL